MHSKTVLLSTVLPVALPVAMNATIPYYDFHNRSLSSPKQFDQTSRLSLPPTPTTLLLSIVHSQNYAWVWANMYATPYTVTTNSIVVCRHRQHTPREGASHHYGIRARSEGANKLKYCALSLSLALSFGHLCTHTQTKILYVDYTLRTPHT